MRAQDKLEPLFQLDVLELTFNVHHIFATPYNNGWKLDHIQ